MRGFTPSNVCQCGLFFALLSFAFAVRLDLTEFKNRVAKFRVNPRGKLWATGHFMGKKSVMDAPLVGGRALGDAQLGEIFQEFLQVVLRTQVDKLDSRSKLQEVELLMKILEEYIAASDSEDGSLNINV